MTAQGDWASRWRVRAGYPVALAFLLFAHPTGMSILAGAILAATGLFVRGAAAGRLYKHEQLATSGPYAYTRNPLYFGSAVLAAGLVTAGASWIAAVLVGGYFLAFYPAVMRKEEHHLRERYGTAFEEYSARVPLFWPRLNFSTRDSASSFSWTQYRRNREYQAALGTLAGFAVMASKPFWAHFFGDL